MISGIAHATTNTFAFSFIQGIIYFSIIIASRKTVLDKSLQCIIIQLY